MARGKAKVVRSRTARLKPRTQARDGRARRRAEVDPGPKTTLAEADKRRLPPAKRSTGEALNRKFDAVPDRIDIRDWFYQPSLRALPDQLVNCDRVPVILDQGQEGACTGYALAAVVNFLLARRNLLGPREVDDRQVSPRMLYEMARRYDEWPGERYSGSSARGAMKGWLRHGVCTAKVWPARRIGARHFTDEVAEDALQTPGGAFYRVMHRQVRDMHAALAETGILYITLMVHRGWDDPRGDPVQIHYVDSDNSRTLDLPVIRRKGDADEGHAVAIVGYTHQGFIIQNSWGRDWGAGGFALLPYEDYMLHAVDVWVAQLGVPVKTDLWVEGEVDTTAGLQRAAPAIPLNQVRPYVVDIGNNGLLSRSGDYWTTPDDLRMLFRKTIPEKTRNWAKPKRRVLLYLHGGLNDERAVARRIVAFRDVFLANGIYPIHIMWESGVWETLRAIIGDYFTDMDERAGGVGDWLRKTREGLIEAKDRTFELTAASLGTSLWSEMKENARLASESAEGGFRLALREAKTAMQQLADGDQEWELHIVAHSAGSIFAAYAMRLISGMGVNVKTLQMMAPAITVELFANRMLPFIESGQCPPPTLYILSDTGERDDDVGPYGKSLLYLVSNAFEARRATPLLGMAKFVQDGEGLDEPENGRFREGFRRTLDLFSGRIDGLPSLVIAGMGSRTAKGARTGATSRSDSHGGFDNDVDTMNSILFRILGGPPREREFVLKDLQYDQATQQRTRSGANERRFRISFGPQDARAHELR